MVSVEQLVQGVNAVVGNLVSRVVSCLTVGWVSECGMANRPAAALCLRDGDRERLLSLIRSSSVRAGLAQRARIVLLAAEGVANSVIAERVGVSRPTVIGWRERYEGGGIDGLHDEARSGRPRLVDHREVVAATVKPPPKKLGATHWSSRLLAARLRISNGTVARA
ncbi:helix-turn-helix domain-containing protein, partial [Amycolatopsis sp. NPDC023774]|uniref:helix-turn-helix domain-containing protein n=1 Tax=Amycolatopsis sp. NPDC023774 TaxID=3155015 RepID=UPI003410DDE9